MQIKAKAKFTRTAKPKKQPAKPLIETTGENPRLDALANVVNSTVEPFTNAPPPHQGAVGVASQAVSGVLGVMSAPDTMLDTAFAMATAGIPTIAMPAAVLGLSMHMGIPHAHAHPPSLIPPAPPVPLPSMGAVAGAGCLSVLLNSVPAARAGDVGLAITCGSLAPPLEVVTGSSSVWIGGARAARATDVTRHDNPVPMGALAKGMAIAGMAASGLAVAAKAMDAAKSEDDAAAAQSAAEAEAAAATAAGEAMAAALQAAQLAADAAMFAMQLLIGKDPGIGPGVGALMPGPGNVSIGGLPTPNLMAQLKGLLKAAKKLKKPKKRDQDADDGPAGVGAKSCKLP